MTFYRKEEFSHSIPAAAVLGQNLSLSFYNCFDLSFGKAGDSFTLQKGLTAVLNKEMRPFILVRDGRLAIDYGSYGNLSDQLNFHLHSLSHLSLNLIILNALNLNSLGRGTNCGRGRWRVLWLGRVQSGVCC